VLRHSMLVLCAFTALNGVAIVDWIMH